MVAANQRRQRRVGTVVSNRSDKTIAVRVESVRRHPLYRKPVRIRRKLLAHDPENACEVGDVVEVTASRPYSRRKRWRLTRIVNRATLTEEEQAAVEAASEAAQAADVEPVEEEATEASIEAPSDAGEDVSETDAGEDVSETDADEDVSETDADEDVSESETR